MGRTGDKRGVLVHISYYWLFGLGVFNLKDYIVFCYLCYSLIPDWMFVTSIILKSDMYIELVIVRLNFYLLESCC